LNKNWFIDIITSPLGAILATGFAFNLLYILYDSIKNKSKNKAFDYVTKYTVDKIKTDNKTKTEYIDIIAKNMTDDTETIAKKIVESPIIKSHLDFAYNDFYKETKTEEKEKISRKEIDKKFIMGLSGLLQNDSFKKGFTEKLKNNI
jgi:hypothetical protein